MKKIKALIMLALLSLTGLISAQTTQFIVHHATGGPADILARITTSYMTGKDYTIINRPGGRGIPAISHLKNSRSIMMANVPQIFVTNPLILKDELSYDPGNDLEIIAVVAVMPNVLICNQNIDFKDFDSLKQSTKSLNFATGLPGSGEHLATELMLSQWKNNHKIIFYSQGGNRTLTDLLGGHVDCLFANYPLVKKMIDQKVLTPLFSSHELNLSVPTWKNVFGKNFPLNNELSIVVNRKIEPSLKSEIKNDLKQAVSSSGYVSLLHQNGFFPVASTSDVAIKNSYRTQQQIKEFIIQNNINLQGE
jgi:tripartite-type tricarboxylate transporter receptor subunit TctC